MEGLPVPFQKFIYGIVTPLEECAHLGGAIEISGNLVSFVRNVLESGMQESLYRRGYPVQQSASLHECANGITLNWFIVKMYEIWEARAKFLQSPSFDDGKRSLILEKKVDKSAESSWKPGTPKGTEPHVRATELLLNQAVGAENWKDSQPNPPSNESGQIFNAKLYKRADWEFAMNNKVGAILYASLFSGFHFIDEDKVNMQAKGGISMVQWIESLRLFGPDGPVCWKVVENGTYHSTTIMFLDYDWTETDSVHLIAVHSAPCNIMQSDPSINYNWQTIDGMGVSALSWQFAIEIGEILAMPNATIDEEEDILSIKVAENVVYQFSESVHNRKLTHVYHKADALRLKQEMVGDTENLYREGANGIRRNNGDYHLFSSNSRLSSSYAINPDGEDRVTRHNKLRRDLAQAFTSTDTIDEGVALLVQACRFDIFNDMSPINDPSKRHGIVMSSGNTFDSTVLTRFDTLYKSTTQNSGNTISNRAASVDEIVDVDTALPPLAESGEGFFIQIAGTSGKNPKNRPKKKGDAKTDFVLPADGTDLGTYEVDGRMKKIVFRKSQFVNITYSGLRERCEKKTNGEGLTKRKKCERFPTKKVRYAKGMITFKKGCVRTIVDWIDANVVYVWLVDKDD